VSVLVVVAHPDDEVLGFGGAGALFVSRGVQVRTCIAVSKADARMSRPGTEKLTDDIYAAQAALGFGEPILGDFPNIRLNTVPHLELVQFIESAIREVAADTLVTHHAGDVNDDHRQVSRACQAAARLFQRSPGSLRLRSLLTMEVLSSTDWQFPGTAPTFTPTTFVEIGEEFLDRKIQALSSYEAVMRPYPHPRSPEAIRGLATVRGAQSGRNLAEAFETGFQVLTP
jgi:LmbE family N-acetylglucosaminyl deacetylase